MHDKPYFMKNKEWFYFDEKEFCYKLTAEAPPEAKASYEKFYQKPAEDYRINRQGR